MENSKKISAAEYHSSEGLSASLAKVVLNKSPYHAWLQSPLNPNRIQAEASRLDIGTAAHAMLLEGMDVIHVCDYDDWRTKAAQAERDDARAAGKIPLLTKQSEQVRSMVINAVDSITQCDDLGVKSWTEGTPEESLYWTDAGTKMRARLDWINHDKTLIIDYKTTDIASPEQWIRGMTGMGYDGQAAHYLAGTKAVYGTDAIFVFCVQEIEAPHLVYFVEPSQMMLEIGIQKMKIAREKWQACLTADKFPAYSKKIMIADSPAWALADIEEKMEGAKMWSKEAFLFGRVAELKGQ